MMDWKNPQTVEHFLDAMAKAEREGMNTPAAIEAARAAVERPAPVIHDDQARVP